MRVCICLLILLTMAVGYSSSAAQDYLWCADGDTVYAEVIESTITVHHDAAVYNCCPEPFQYDVSLQDGVIEIREVEVLENPCFCICCFDLSVEIEDVAPGSHQVLFSWFDYETDQWREWYLEVHVPDVDQNEGMTVIAVSEPDCVELTGVNEEAQPEEPGFGVDSWGRIKIRYR